MNEIISLHGLPFHRSPVQRQRRRLLSFRRVIAALFLIFCSAGIVAAVGWVTYETALIERRAREGDANAQYRFGKRALGKAQSAKAQAQALGWIQLAADQGQVDAQTALGFLYSRQAGSAQDYPVAVRWFRKAAIQGNVAAQNELAAMFASGRGVARDVRKAIWWYGEAAARGSRLAKANLELVRTAGSRSLGDLTTREGQRYMNVALRTIESDGIMIAYDSGKDRVGLVKVRRDDLPENLQQLCKFSSKTNSPGNRAAPWL